ncbi:DUF2062 domain-containing protein [Leptospira wolffii]|uniref:DUF2062 domain-containing protein n=1 Tax=Leptospira wolffii TaxID=409998 RepID=UPI000352A498|nr:DUF2062 domain-containing protein [Leptospira wolffii]EPG65946.1 PF09835 family protein [Leptospira wolffii serovar Khorat str. Khorat-H2]
MTQETESKPNIWVRSRDRILEELKTGTSPKKIALSLALGAAFGVFPLIGTTMALCALLGFLLRLNPVSIQIANYAVYPFQVLLLVPFLQLGSNITGKDLDLQWAYLLAEGDTSLLWDGLSRSAMYAVLGWTCVVPLVSFFSYFLFLFLVKNATRLVRK